MGDNRPDPAERAALERQAGKDAHIRALQDELADYQRRLEAAKAAKDKVEIAKSTARLNSVEDSIGWPEAEPRGEIP